MANVGFTFAEVKYRVWAAGYIEAKGSIEAAFFPGSPFLVLRGDISELDGLVVRWGGEAHEVTPDLHKWTLSATEQLKLMEELRSYVRGNGQRWDWTISKLQSLSKAKPAQVAAAA